MQNSLPDRYRILETKDGSPTLELKTNELTENMHNFHGAFSETDYIYGEALRESLKSGIELKVLSVGLGLGYNEMMTAAFAKAHQVPCQLWSFERDEFLREAFLRWLKVENHGPVEPNPLAQTYEQILGLWSERYQLEPAPLKEFMKTLTLETRFEYLSGFDPLQASEQKFSVLFYDPFSAKTNPEFWSEASLQQFLLGWAADSCVFSTYAATGALKRSLVAAGFEVQVRPGFGGKRQSFLAVRYR